jgi:opacity protein-like surface antigen
VGLSLNYSSKQILAEVMGIAGNFQVSPDDFRKRWYSGYVSFLPSKTFEIGASSMWTVTQADFDTLQPQGFMAHGLFTRAAPVPPLAIMAEADVTIANNSGQRSLGLVGTGIVDWEAMQGLHVQGIGQYCDSDFGNTAAAAWNGGLGAQWFFFSHMDVRLDGAYGSLFCTQGATPSPYGLVQAHIYL